MKELQTNENPGFIENAVSKILKESSDYKGVSEELLFQILSSGTILELEKDEILIHQGAENDYMVYFLLDGLFDVFADGNFILKLNRPGLLIGEMAVISSAPRSAEVRARIPSIVIGVNSNFINSQDVETMKLANNFMKMYSRVLTQKLRVTTERAKLYEDAVLENKEIEEYSQGLKKDIKEKLEQIKLYSQVVECNQDAIIICDSEGRIQSVNQSFCTLFGYTPSEVGGLSIVDLVQNLLEPDTTFSGIFRSGWKGERPAIKKNKETFPSFLSISPVTSTEDGKVVAYSVELIDNTVKKKYENSILEKKREVERLYQELESTVEELEQSNKVKNEFLSSMSVQLKSPLLSIKSYSEILFKYLQQQGSPTEINYLHSIQDKSQVLEKMVRNLLTMAELNTGLSSLNLNQVKLADLWEVIFAQLPKTQKRRLRLAEDPKSISFVGDREKLLKAFEELIQYLLNELKIEDEQILICHETILEREALEISLFRGFPQEKCSSLLTLFSQIETRVVQGLDVDIQKENINIPLAKRIIELHKGNIKIQSLDNRARILIQLPLDLEKSAQKALKIMLVDENESDRLIYSGVIKNSFEHSEIYEFDDQIEAINSYNSIEPDLLILDPFFKTNHSHWEIGEFIKKFVPTDDRSRTAIVVIGDALSDGEVRNHVIELGITDFLPKPFTLAEIRFKISSIIQMRRQVSILSEDIRKAEKSAVTDGMTGLFNRRYYDKFISEQLMKSEIQGGKCSVIMLDVDNFKHYNDTNGHQLGDEVLKKVASILKAGVRESDMVARYGGEEFVVVLPGTAKEMAMHVAEKLRTTMFKSDFPNGKNQPLGFLSASFGVSTFPENGKTPDVLLKGADHCLYIAKERGRNLVIGADGIVTE